MKVCNHNHRKEHINYLHGQGYTETDEGAEKEYSYTIKIVTLVCVQCLFIVHESKRRIVYLVMHKDGTEIVNCYNQPEEASSYASYINGQYIEAEVAGSL